MATKQSQNPIAEATFAPFSFAWRLCLSVALLWFVSVCVQIAYVYWTKVDAREHIVSMVDYYVEHSPASGMINSVALSTYNAIFERLNLKLEPGSDKRAPEIDRSDPHIARAVGRGATEALRKPLLVAALATVLFTVRLTLLGLAAPYFCILLVVGLVDGLVQRYVRKSCGGHESAAMYHRAKKFGFRYLPSLAGSFLLCWPEPFEVAWLFVPTAMASAVFLRVQATYYKKYL